MATNIHNFISFDKLTTAVDNDTVDNNYKIAGDFLISAINDWPTLNLREPSDFVVELQKEIKGKLTFDNLDKYSKYLRPDNDAWKMCAVTSLLEMFDFNRTHHIDKTITLDELIAKLTKYYSTK